MNATSADYRLCVAPMMAWTDRHCRAFHRCLSPSARLYTEMLSTDAILHGPRERLLQYDAIEHPVALQVGGSDPVDLARCAALAKSSGFDEINLNVGCPSERVKQGAFGACLMLEPARVAEGLAAMREATQMPVTVKCRIGVDDRDDYGLLRDFVGRACETGTSVFMVHARIAVLSGLSPAQ
ncbi:MAG: tRNA dihydrouridine(20/20a) synthase DusA, partial [Gammaproteobacteria bacterium]|nr:tRNA dihydrouridine(20/20a) synthase DusA [Gammaproteobacteria bacterium]